MSNPVLLNKLNSAINSQMCAFLSQVSTKYGMDISTLESDWSNFSGMKPKIKKMSGPKLSDLKAKCKELDIPSAGTKGVLQDRIDAFSRKEIDTITAGREKRKAERALKKESEEPKKKVKKEKKKKSSTKSTSSSKSGSSISDLKEQLKDAGLPRTGNKAVLQQRLDEHSDSLKSGKVNYHTWKIGKIRSELKDRGGKIKPGMKKEELVGLLTESDLGTKSLSKSHVKDSDSDECSGCSDSECDECETDTDCSDCETDSDSDSDDENSEKMLKSLQKELKIGERTWTKHDDGHWGPRAN
jgi:hypothetical protein